jgi:hypothetical protein
MPDATQPEPPANDRPRLTLVAGPPALAVALIEEAVAAGEPVEVHDGLLLGGDAA